MPPKSSLKRLPPEVLAEINKLLSEGRMTLDELLAHLRGLGVDSVSRSALGRQKQKIDKIAAKLRQSREVTASLVRELGPDSTDGEQGRLLVEMLRNMVFDALGERVAGGEALDPKAFASLSRTARELAQAVRLNQDFELKVRERVEKDVLSKLESAAQKAGQEASLSPVEAFERVRAIYRGEA